MTRLIKDENSCENNDFNAQLAGSKGFKRDEKSKLKSEQRLSKLKPKHNHH